MSEVKLQPGPGVTRAGGVDSVDTGTVCSLRGSDHVSILSTDNLTAPAPALTLTLTLCTGGGGAVTHVNSAHFHKQPAPPRPNTAQPPSLQQYWQHRHQDPGHSDMETPVISVISCIALLSMHAHSISASTVPTEMCLPAGWCPCLQHSLLGAGGAGAGVHCAAEGELWSRAAGPMVGAALPASPAQPALPTCLLPGCLGRATPCNTTLSTMHTVYNNAIAARYSCHTGKSPHAKRLSWMFLIILHTGKYIHILLTCTKIHSMLWCGCT